MRARCASSIGPWMRRGWAERTPVRKQAMKKDFGRIRCIENSTFADLDLFLFRDIRGGPVVQIESSFQRKASTRQTTVALHHHFHGVTPPDAHLAARFRQQLGRTGGVQRGALLQVLTSELNLPGLENLVEADLTQLQHSDTKEHEG